MDIQLPSDIILILVDTFNEIIIPTHKNILIQNSPYFEKMFGYFKEKDQCEITIHVPNSSVTRDIIMNFYGQEFNSTNLDSWKYQLDLINCRDYLCIKHDLDSIKNLNVPVEGFDLLLGSIDLIGYNDITIKLIGDNLPENYDISKLSRELINEIIYINTSYQIISGSNCKIIKKWDAVTGKLIGKFSLDYYDARQNPFSTKQFRVGKSYICCSPDNTQIATGDDDKAIRIWDILTGKLIRTLYIHVNICNSICYSPDAKRIATGNGTFVKVWDAFTGNLIMILKRLTQRGIYITSIHYSYDNKEIAAGYNDGKIKIWDVLTGYPLRSFDGISNIDRVCYSYDNRQILSVENNAIKVWEASTGNLIYTLIDVIHKSAICYSPDNQKIVTGNIHGDIKIWDANNGQLLCTLIGLSKRIIYSVCYTPDNQKIIIGSEDGIITIYDASTGTLLKTLKYNRFFNKIKYLSVMPIIDNKLIRKLSTNFK